MKKRFEKIGDTLFWGFEAVMGWLFEPTDENGERHICGVTILVDIAAIIALIVISKIYIYPI